MRSENERQDLIEPSAHRELQILSEVEESPEVTQRDLSRRTGTALGLTNVLLRNLVQKGYVRASQANWKRWLYTLTPEGISHKIRLTTAYIHRVLDHYQKVRQTLREQLEPLRLHEESRIAIYGTGEFAKLVYLGLKELGIEEIEVYGPEGQTDQKFLGMPVRDLNSLNPDQYDRVLIGYLGNQDSTRSQLSEQGVNSDKLVVFFSSGLAGRV